jgi:hypothetical protein
MNVDAPTHPEASERSGQSMRLTDLILHIPGFLSDTQCKVIIEEHRARELESQLEHCPEATSGVDTYSSFKAIQLIKNTEAFAIVHNGTEEMINRYHRYLDGFGMFHTMRKSSML